MEKKLGVERLELDQLKQRFEILDEISVKLSKEWVLKLTVSACYSQVSVSLLNPEKGCCRSEMQKSKTATER